MNPAIIVIRIVVRICSSGYPVLAVAVVSKLHDQWVVSCMQILSNMSFNTEVTRCMMAY